jgi:two-component system chemotaxis response regulator CheB
MTSPQSGSPVVVIGASAGGVEALKELVAALPLDFPASVLVVLHLPPSGTSALPAILDRAGPLPARHAVDGDPLRPGQILIGPPDRHLFVLDDHVRLTRGPRENGHRPAVDVLFRSAARALGARIHAVVLSGSLDDGAAGALAVVSRGGDCLVQDFDEALHDGMPRATATAVGLEGLPVKEIASRLAEVAVASPAAEEWAVPEVMEVETAMAELDPQAMHDPERPGRPSGFAYPDCHGVLFEIDDHGLPRFRCRVGHAWSAESLVARQTIELEGALWMALRSLEEKAALNEELARRARERGSALTAVRFDENAAEATQAAEMVRTMVADMGGLGERSTQP